MPENVQIDGSMGEGGGQVLRTSLALSLVTGKPFKITKIRAGRKRPGLQRQHLTSVEAARQVGQAEVRGNVIDSQELYFEPRTVRPGRYHFNVGTAGSATLVFETVLPALLLVNGKTELIVEGGTHNPFAPPYDFLAKTLLPLMNRMGPRVTAVLERPGFYPAGGGRIKASVESDGHLNRLDILERGEVRKYMARAIVARLPRHVAERELKVIGDRLLLTRDSLHVDEVAKSPGPGNVVIVEVECDLITEVFTAFGRRGLAAEQVAEKVVAEVLEYLSANVPVGKYLADQLLIPMALAGGGRFGTLKPTLHTQTNMDVLGRFLQVEISMSQLSEVIWEIEIKRDKLLS